MRKTRVKTTKNILILIFMAIFAMPFLGGRLLVEDDMETKIIGGILCAIGLAIWFLFGLH